MDSPPVGVAGRGRVARLHRIAFAWATLAACGIAHEAAAQGPIDAAVPFVRAFRDVDGLPQNTVHSIALDHDGYLWAGTPDGAARYDGRRWETRDLPGDEPVGPVRAMLATRDGSFWFGTQEAGLFRLVGDAWQRIPSGPETYPARRINALAETVDGGRSTLWLALHEGGVAAFDGSAWRTWDRRHGLPSDRVWSLLVEGQPGAQSLWLATGNGLARLVVGSGTIEVSPATVGFSFSSLALQAEPGRPGRLVAGSYGNGLFRREWSGEWRRLGPRGEEVGAFVTSLASDPDDPGAVWIGTDGWGLALLEGERVAPVTLGAELDSRAIYWVTETSAEQGASAVWIGSRNNGLLRMSEGSWKVVHPFPGVSSSVSALMIRKRDGLPDELWAGLDGRGLSRWTDGTWRRYDAQSGVLGHDTVQAIVETTRLPGGPRVWVGTRNGGVSEWNGTTWRIHDRASGALPNDLVQCLVEAVGADGRGELWVGTREGIARFDGRVWSRPGEAEGWPLESIHALAATDPARDPGPPTVWIASSAGLHRWRDGQLTHWGVDAGMPKAAALSLHLRRDGGGKSTLWVGTEGGGLALLDAVADRPQPRSGASVGIPELPNRVIHAIVEDRKRRVYLSTNRGVVRLAEQGERFTPTLFTAQNGLPLHQGMRGSATVDDEGRVWIGTVGGIGVLDPESERADRTPKRLVVSFGRVSRASERLASGAELDPNPGPLRFRYTLLSFLGEPLTLYRTQLVDREEEPTAWDAATERELVGLAPGRYRFRVWGRDGSGNVSAPVEIAFRIRPAFWQRADVRIGFTVALVLGTGIGFARRTRRHERREHELEELVAARTRRLERANQILSELSYVDALTGVPNRRRFDETLELEWKRAIRTRAPLSVVMVDIDHFKPFNDAFGHPVGDERLRQVASALADTLSRAGDLVARYGGEEFGLILPSTDSGGAMVVGEQLRRAVAERRIPHGAPGVAPFLTVSCGVASVVPELALDRDRLVVAADTALYDAKRAGRNRVARREVDGAAA